MVASGGTYQPGNEDQFGAGGPDALTTKIHDVSLPDSEQCLNLEILDSYGDGWSLTDGSITPGVEIFSGGNSIYSTGNVGNFGDSKSYFNAFKYTTTLSINKFDEYNFTMYPNPTNGIVNMSANKPFGVEIFNFNGKLVYDTKINQSQQIDLSQLSSGVYLSRITINSATKTNKLIIK